MLHKHASFFHAADEPLLSLRPDIVGVVRSMGTDHGSRDNKFSTRTHTPIPTLPTLWKPDRYIIKNLGTKACPAGRLFEGLPAYTGTGGGGSDVAATAAVESKKSS